MNYFVFDLDFTIWNAGGTFCSETSPPYSWNNNKLVDKEGRWIRLYPDVVRILKMLQMKKKTIIAASRTYEPDQAIQLLNLFEIEKYFNFKEIYPGPKVTHFKNIIQQINSPLDHIVFFDDEQRNIDDVKALGIESILVDNGIRMDMVSKYIKN
jgi:magnesium-dependent phosphatase 1